MEKGQLRFKDGVSKAKIMVIATIKQVDKNGDVKLEFYLSSKAEWRSTGRNRFEDESGRWEVEVVSSKRYNGQ